MTWRTSGTPGRRSGPATGSARRRLSRRCPSRSAARTAGVTGRLAPAKQRAIATRRALDTRPSCLPTTGTPCCRRRGPGSASPRHCRRSGSTSAPSTNSRASRGFCEPASCCCAISVSRLRTEWRIAYELLAPEQQVQAIGLADRWGLAPPVDRRRRAADAVQRLSAALSAALRQGGAGGGAPHRSSRRAHLRGDPAGKPVSRGRKLERRSAWPDAAAADDRAARGAALGSQGACSRRSAPAVGQRSRRRRGVEEPARPIRRPDAPRDRGLQRGPGRRAALAARDGDGQRHLGGEHSVQRDAYLCAARRMAHPGVRVARRSQGARRRDLARPSAPAGLCGRQPWRPSTAVFSATIQLK